MSRSRLFLSLLLVGICLAAPQAAQADSFTVNEPGDPGVASCPTTCSLRAAVTAANGTPGDDTISVPANTYSVTQGEIMVGGAAGTAITITGAGAASTVIDAGDSSRVFNIDSGSGVATVANVSGVTLQNGRASGMSALGSGGAVLVATASTLNMSRSRVTSSHADLSGGGISVYHTGGVLNLSESLVDGNDAGGPAVVTNAQGGGIFSAIAVNVTNSTITQNTVQSTLTAQGGGLGMTGGTGTLVNSTVSHNSTGGSGVATGSGLLNVAGLNATNTIVSDNTGAANCAVPAVGVTVANNLSSDASCGFAAGGGKENADPALGALADNGGPTPTRAIAQSSPAANAGTATGCPATDQRGVARPQGPACDIGAFEALLTPANTGGGGGGGGTTPPRTSAGRKPGLKVTGVPKSCRRSTFEIRLRSSVSGTGVKLRSVRVTLDRKKLKTVTKAGRFRVKVKAGKLKRGKHAIRVYVTDSKGRVTSLKRTFTRCKPKAKPKSKSKRVRGA